MSIFHLSVCFKNSSNQRWLLCFAILEILQKLVNSKLTTTLFVNRSHVNFAIFFSGFPQNSQNTLQAWSCCCSKCSQFLINTRGKFKLQSKLDGKGCEISKRILTLKKIRKEDFQDFQTCNLRSNSCLKFEKLQKCF